jgi:phosphoglycolate phosphatase
MNFSVVVFDWDGTLVDSEHHIVNSLAHAAQRLDLPSLSHDRLKSIIGLGLREAIGALYPDLSEQGFKDFRALYAEHYFSKPMGADDLFEGVESTLQALQERQVRLAVATGKNRHGLDRALAATGLGRWFTVTRCADETQSKPHPQMLQEIAQALNVGPQRMLMVGDSSFDLEMAQRFGIASVGVSYGVHDPVILQRYNPLRIVDRLGELLDLCGS